VIARCGVYEICIAPEVASVLGSQNCDISLLFNDKPDYVALHYIVTILAALPQLGRNVFIPATWTSLIMWQDHILPQYALDVGAFKKSDLDSLAERIFPVLDPVMIYDAIWQQEEVCVSMLRGSFEESLLLEALIASEPQFHPIAVLRYFMIAQERHENLFYAATLLLSCAAAGNKECLYKIFDLVFCSLIDGIDIFGVTSDIFDLENPQFFDESNVPLECDSVERQTYDANFNTVSEQQAQSEGLGWDASCSESGETAECCGGEVFSSDDECDAESDTSCDDSVWTSETDNESVGGRERSDSGESSGSDSFESDSSESDNESLGSHSSSGSTYSSASSVSIDSDESDDEFEKFSLGTPALDHIQSKIALLDLFWARLVNGKTSVECEYHMHTYSLYLAQNYKKEEKALYDVWCKKWKVKKKGLEQSKANRLIERGFSEGGACAKVANIIYGFTAFIEN
jgi:hypothetical protein